MATIKLKFRESRVRGREGTLYFQLFHNRVARQITTPYKIYSCEWDIAASKIIIPKNNDSRTIYLRSIKANLKFELDRLKRIVYSLAMDDKEFDTDDVVTMFRNEFCGAKLFGFAQSVIDRLRLRGNIRTSETYATTLRSFMRFRGGEDIALKAIDSDVIQDYECYLKHEEIVPNTISFYMRILRAIYNRAVEKGLIDQQYPFKHVYTGVDKTVKRAIHVKYFKSLKELDLSCHRSLDIVRDMFLFSFYTRGMSFVDMAFLRKRDLDGGILSYRRRKTNQQLHIKWETCMQDIVDKYDTSKTSYLLPIIKKTDISDRNQYRNALISYNNRLKRLGEMIGVPTPLTMYVARHSWASVAKSSNIPLSVISESMGHDSETTTQIYLSSLDTSIIDRANHAILRLL